MQNWRITLAFYFLALGIYHSNQKSCQFSLSLRFSIRSLLTTFWLIKCLTPPHNEVEVEMTNSPIRTFLFTTLEEESLRGKRLPMSLNLPFNRPSRWDFVSTETPTQQSFSMMSVVNCCGQACPPLQTSTY